MWGPSQLVAMRYGSVPLVRATGGQNDTVIPYNEYTRKGNGFSGDNVNTQNFLSTLHQALDLYHDKVAWIKIVKNV